MIKTLDRYVVRSFLYSYLLCLLVMIGLRLVSDLFLNMDEFAEMGAKFDLDWTQLLTYVGGYYLYNTLVYFQELGGVILVAAAAFSLAKMNRTNEVTAILASGVSLHRVILPVILVALVFSVAGAVNEEVLIPQARHGLTRDRDEVPGMEVFQVRLINDGRRNVWYSRACVPATGWMRHPLIVARDRRLKHTATISGLQAVYGGDGTWRVDEAILAVPNRDGATTATILTALSPGVLADAGPSGGIDSNSGLRVSADKIDPASGLLLGPRFEFLREGHSGRADGADVIATICADRAVYGPVGRKGDDPGYRLFGSPILSAEQVKDWTALCEHLAPAGERVDPAQPCARLWAWLSEPLRSAVKAAGGQSSDPAGAGLDPRARRDLVAAINQAIRDRRFYRPGDFDPAALAEDERGLLKRDRRELTEEQFMRLNRLALDRYWAGAVVTSQGYLSIATDLTPQELALRHRSRWMQYMSSAEINRLLQSGKVTDPASASLTKHLRFTTPIANIIMLLVGLPFILSRERNIKASASLCLAMVAVFYIFLFVSRYLGAYGLSPAVAAWLPILVFGPVAVLMLDAIKT